MYRSTDDGHSWQAVDSGSKSSLTDLVQVGERVVGVGLDGVQVESRNGGASFTGSAQEDRLSMTALVAAPARNWSAFRGAAWSARQPARH